MQTTYLSMGSNIGDRQYYLHEAIRLLGKHPKIMIEKVSNFYESTPVGGVKQDDFTNLALKVATLLEPLELLSFIHEVELSLNRERKIHWGPRTIDIDIIFPFYFSILLVERLPYSVYRSNTVMIFFYIFSILIFIDSPYYIALNISLVILAINKIQIFMLYLNLSQIILSPLLTKVKYCRIAFSFFTFLNSFLILFI